MSWILNIDTAIQTASICLAKNGEPVSFVSNDDQKDHASWLHQAIKDLIEQHQLTLNDLNAVAVSNGPGSYTGLRVGLATAKGLCYALQIPLITIGTLKVIAYAAKAEASDWIVPLIDARRMEVYWAAYDIQLGEKISPMAMIIDKGSFDEWLTNHQILFCGNGLLKLRPLLHHKNAQFSTINADATHLARLSQIHFHREDFSNLAYTEPLYVKDFHTYKL